MNTSPNSNETHNINEIVANELTKIAERRRNHNQSDKEIDTWAICTDTVRDELVGLSFSGGGVRSGATSLGLLQSFHDSGFVGDVDYLSTVSGGSYAGAFFSSDAVSHDRSSSSPECCELDSKTSPKPNPNPFHRSEGRPSRRILEFVFGGKYLRDTAGFLNRQMFGMLLVLTVVLSGITTISAFVAWLVRLIDHEEVRYYVRALGFESELTLAFLPAIFALCVWVAMWGFAYLRRTNDQQRTAARYSFYVFLFFFLVGIANLIGTGDLFLGGKSNAAATTNVLHHTWTLIVTAVGASLLPYFAPKSLIKSGTKPRNPKEKYSFWIATNGLLIGLPFLIVGVMLQENISGVNGNRTGKIVARSEIRNWRLGETTNGLWSTVLQNSSHGTALTKPAAIGPVDGKAGILAWMNPLKLVTVDRNQREIPPLCRADNYAASFEAWQSLKGNEAKSSVELAGLFRTLNDVNRQLAVHDRNSIVRYWIAIPFSALGNPNSILSVRFQLMRTHGTVKNLLADWLGNQMTRPDFYNLVVQSDRLDGIIDPSKGVRLTPSEKEASRIIGQLRGIEKLSQTDSVSAKVQYESLNRELLLALFPDDVQPQSTIKSFVCLNDDQVERLEICAIALVVFFVSSIVVDLNSTSCHSFYRNRLKKMWIEKGAGLDTIPLSQLETTKHGYPYHLMLGSMAYFGKFDKERGPEKIDHFLFSRLYCGSERTGFVSSDEYMDGQITLGDAVAISGAAISVVHIKNALIMFLLFITNLRLGQWLKNPRFKPRKGNRGVIADYLARTPLGLLCNLLRNADDRPYVFVADGGHFENLAVDELIRRRCRLIVALDAGADPKFKMEDLARLVRWARMKHGVRLTPIHPEEITEAEFVAQVSGNNFAERTQKSGSIDWAKANYLMWRIEYPAKENRPTTGVLIYVKNTMTGREPLELIKYQNDDPDFPHDSTTDQFFDPGKFESYRLLGEHLGESVFRDIRRRILLREFDSAVMDCLELSSCLVPHRSDIADSAEVKTAVEFMMGRLKTTGDWQKKKIVSVLQRFDPDIETTALLLQLRSDEHEDVSRIATNMLAENVKDLQTFLNIIEKSSRFQEAVRRAAVEHLVEMERSADIADQNLRNRVQAAIRSNHALFKTDD